jgi:hypothetical protein
MMDIEYNVAAINYLSSLLYFWSRFINDCCYQALQLLIAMTDILEIILHLRLKNPVFQKLVLSLSLGGMGKGENLVSWGH